ncbi:MAG TPA: M1 family metallopeptidase [Acidobacteriaceae bacterium]|jgi:aminopeptidase N/puromycin-sensitive aminopeptidase|nr:M1 family metallopeptidase [Acidobacteriaceae bacterium]
MSVSRLCQGLFCLAFVTATVAYGQRLPDTVTPQHYTLKLTPDLKAATFTGVETIDVDVKQPVPAIVLNAAEIKFGTVTAEVDGKELHATVTLDNTKEQASLNFGQALQPGPLTVHIDYTGILNNELRGFYLSKTKTRNYAVTQFEPTDARRAFPGFDEPAFKATFSVTLVVPKGDTAISNTNVVSQTPGPQPDQQTVQFATTPKMSTYLVAFLVGDFQCISGQSDGIPIRVCGSPDKLQYAHFALAAAEFNLHFYDQYFGIKYPMPKLDLIGIPDFEAGAMENFGAITFRETALFVDEKTASLASKKEVAEDVAHEMAHQWFGDMVTMDWWNNIWLNEGFATWMENKPVTAWKPEWQVPQDVAEGLNGTLNYDAQKVTRAIRAKADTPAEINQMFDGISYGKAAAVLLMTEQYEGPETFRRGVHKYLEAHMLGNATAVDFWNAQAAVSHKPVDKILSSYVTEAGEPALHFSQPQNGKVQVSQQRFFLNPKVKPDAEQTWTIPVCFAVPHADAKCDVLSAAQGTLRYPSAGLFFPDAGGRGYYRFALPNDVYARVLAGVETELTPEERIAVLGDEWAGVRADYDSVGDYLHLAEAVRDDSSAAVVETATTPLGTIDERIATTPAEHEALAKWVVKTFKPVYERLGAPSPSDSPNTKELRSALFGVLGTVGKDPDIIAESKKIAVQYLANPGSVDPNLAQVAAAIAAENGDAAFFDQLQHAFETANNPQIQEYALRLLALFRNPELQKRSLEFAVSGKVRNQDAIFQLLIPMQFPETRAIAWDFMRNNWDQVKAQLTTWMGGYLVGGTGTFCSEEKKQQVVDFFSTHKVAASDVSLQRAKDAIDDCVDLRSTQGPKLAQWASGE